MSDDIPLEPPPDGSRFVADVIDLGGYRIQWGRSPHRSSLCKHQRLFYASDERRFWCADCERTIENFDAAMTLVRHFQEMERDARVKIQKADAAMAATIHRRGTKALDKAWSGSLPAVACPHCRKGLLPEDFEKIGNRSSREYEMARRKRDLP